jgi:hypothetical protein
VKFSEMHTWRAGCAERCKSGFGERRLEKGCVPGTTWRDFLTMPVGTTNGTSLAAHSTF